MTLTELRYIAAVARLRHFGKAAEACFVSQPTLSVAVRKLEEELEVTLFERRRNEIALTPVGERIVAQARRVLEEAERVRQIARQGKDDLALPLSLGAIFTIGPYLLPAIIPQLGEQAPALSLVIREDYTRNLATTLHDGQLDVAVIALPFDEPGIALEPLYEEPFLVVMPARHHWAGRAVIPAGELSEETVLLLRAGNCFREQVLEACPACRQDAREFSGALQRTLEGSSLETIRQMTATGVGVSVMPCTAWHASGDLRGALIARPFAEPSPRRTVALAYRKSFPRARAIEALREAVAKAELPCVQKLSAGGGCSP